MSAITKVDKPWGYELHWAKTDRYVGKVLHVKAGHALSLQYHNIKDETIFLWTGKLLFEIGDGDTLVKREMLPGRERAHHAEDHSSHDGDRRQRHLRSINAGAGRCGQVGGQIRKGGERRVISG